MAVQIRNSQMVDLLTADFIRRNEPAPYLGRVISTYLALPQLRGFWPFSSVDENNDPYDMSMQGRTLTNNNSVAYGTTDFLPYAEFDGSTNYFSRADEPGLSTTGSLTLGCWVRFDGSTGVNQYIINRRDASNYSYYTFRRNADNKIRFIINATSGTVDTVATNNGEWYFFVARYDQGTTTNTVFLNDNTPVSDNTAGASINNTSVPLAIGARSDGTLFMDGRIALPFICATNLSDARISNLYQQSKVLFGG